MSNNPIANLFIKEAIKTESSNFEEIAQRLNDKRTIRLLHAALGLSTEANEFLDALKKYIFYGKDLDLINIGEEIGDSFWYQAIACDELGKSFEEIQVAVIQKLRKRYHEKSFSSEAAINRDLDSERNELEKTIDLASGYNMGTKRLTESIVNKIKMEITDEPLTHWLTDADKLTILCTGEKATGEDKFTLNKLLLTCHACIKKHDSLLPKI